MEAAQKTMKLTKQYRSSEIDRKDIDGDKRTVALSFSSEKEVQRWYGMEILDHTPESVDLRRLKRGGALLVDHDMTKQVGVIEEVLIGGADRKGRAIVRFGKSARAEEIFQDIQDGIRQNVSVGYRIHDLKHEGMDGQTPVYRAMKWEPYEISIVSIPEDYEVGINRAEAGKENTVTVTGNEEEKTEAEDNPQEEAEEEKEIRKMDNTAIQAQPQIDVTALKNEERELERKRVKEIIEISKRTEADETLTRTAIETGQPANEFAIQALTLRAAKPVSIDANIGMSKHETENFSIIRAIRALTSGDKRGAEFEFEASAAVAKKIGKEPQGIFMPYDVMTSRRDLVKGTPSAGGYTVATELLSASFIELLRNRMVIRALGARVISGLVGDVAIPKQSGGATAYWVAENGAPTEGAQTFGQLALTPKTVGAYVNMSRKLIIQSSIDMEAFVREDLASVMALAIDYAAINGTGSNNQPYGILGTNTIGAVVGGTDGAAPTLTHIIALETALANSNADVGSLAYLTNAKVRGKLKTTFSNATYGEIPLWSDGAGAGEGRLNGYRAAVSNQVPSTLTKGGSTSVCSALIFGNFADMIIAEWGALDVLVDPYTGSAAGTVRVRVLQDIDVGLRHAESFAAMQDVLTS